ncbi:MAG: DUF695 domain-containing protein [Cyclobacteriaceae bacterium]
MIEASESTHHPDWDFFFTKVDGKISTVALDLGLYHIAPIAGKTFLLWVSVLLKEATPDGLSTEKESQALTEIERYCVKHLQNARYCGRLTGNHHRDLYFYLSKADEAEDALQEVRERFSNYKITTGVKSDPEWKIYSDFLYPSPVQLQAILNKRLVKHLESEGLDLSRTYRLLHTLYFKTEANRAGLLNALEGKRFSVRKKEQDHDQKEFPYVLQLEDKETTDLQQIDEYVLRLLKQVLRYEGNYDGWEIIS